jgi:hypothetical protein
MLLVWKEGRKGSWVGLLGGGWNEWDEEGGPVFKGGGSGCGGGGGPGRAHLADGA